MVADNLVQLIANPGRGNLRSGGSLAYANKSQRQMVFALTITIFAQESAEAAHGQWRIVTDRLREDERESADQVAGSAGAGLIRGSNPSG